MAARGEHRPIGINRQRVERSEIGVPGQALIKGAEPRGSAADDP
jgi:hypothetical protein